MPVKINETPSEVIGIGVAFAGRKASKKFVEAVKNEGYHVISLPQNCWTYNPVNDHPDLFFFTLPDRKICVTTKQLLPFIKSHIEKHLPDWRFCLSENEVVGEYPANVGLNVMTIGQYVVANMKYIDRCVLNILRALNYKTIHVNQGYVKCTTIKIDDSSCLTSDASIESALKQNGIDVLYVDPRSIKLNGFSHGFIGGAAVRLDNCILFNGDIKKHFQYELIKAFIEERGLTCVAVGENELEDVGGIELLKF